jgi:hypothetical protein
LSTKKHEAKTWAWSGKTTEGQASPSDCHEAAMDNLSSLLYASLESGHNFSSESIFIFNFNVDDVI